jgi:hypothetical protein
MSEYGLDTLSRHSKSCVVNDDPSFTTHDLATGYQGVGSKLFRFVIIRQTRGDALTPHRETRQVPEASRQ